MPEEWYKEVAKTARGKGAKDATTKKAKEYKKEALKDVPKDVDDIHAYATAVMKRRLHGTGSKKPPSYESKILSVEEIAESIKDEDIIPGGLAREDGPLKIDFKELIKGIIVELEHTSDDTMELPDRIRAAADIAVDHIKEVCDYYTRLKDMENEAHKNNICSSSK